MRNFSSTMHLNGVYHRSFHWKTRAHSWLLGFLAVFFAIVNATVLVAADLDSYERIFRMGKRAYDKRDFETAISYFTQCIETNPSSAEAYIWRGNALAEKVSPERERAMSDYNKAIAAEPQRAEAHFSKGVLSAELGDINAAINEYDVAISLKPDYAPPLINRGQLLVAKKRYKDAVEDLNKAIKLNPKNYMGYYWRAYALYYSGDESGAILDFEMVINAKVNDARFYNDFAWILATSNNPKIRNVDRAIELARKAIKLVKNKKDLPHIHDTLATAYENANKPELSKKHRTLSDQGKMTLGNESLKN